MAIKQSRRSVSISKTHARMLHSVAYDRLNTSKSKVVEALIDAVCDGKISIKEGARGILSVHAGEG